MCRRRLFLEADIIPHEPQQGADGEIEQQNAGGFGSFPSQPSCTSLFLDPDVASWVAVESRSARAVGELDPDTIYCPFCHVKLGTQSWSGSRCSCGKWITPAFKVLKKSVDAMPLFEREQQEEQV